MGWPGVKVAACALALAACRINFDSQDSTRDDGGTPDAEPDMLDSQSAGVRRTFCERPTGCDVQGVVADTTLTNVSSIFNFGVLNEAAATNSSADVEYVALRFDLSSVVPGTVVESATLELFTKDAMDEILGPVSAHLFTRAWAEGLSNGDNASGATWQRADVGMNWTTPGGDVRLEPTAAGMPPGPGMPFTLSLPALLVQEWIDTPAFNFGMRIGADPTFAGEVHWHFRTKEEIAEGPILTVYLRDE
jgi:hypothetical protein